MTLKNQIIMLDENNFYVESRGSKMKLSKTGSEPYPWQMFVDNASVRAYGTIGLKEFTSLEEVESNYKSWHGISALFKSLSDDNQIEFS